MASETKIPAVPQKEFFKSQYGIINDTLNTFSSYQERFGEFVKVNVGGTPVFLTTGPDYVAHILVKNNRNYQKDKPTRIVKDYIGNGILTSEPPYWLRQRRLIQPAFHRAQIKNLSRIITQESQSFLHRIPTDGQPVELHEKMVDLTLNVVSKSLFSTGVDEDFMRSIDGAVSTLMELAVARIRNPLKVLQYRVTGRMKEFDRKIKDLDEAIYRIIHQRKQMGVQNQDLLDMLLSAKDADTEEVLSDPQIKEEALVLFLAGYDTSSNAMTNILTLLSKHPEMKEKAQKEADEIVRDGNIAFEDIRNMPYITKVIKESLRLYPPAWATGRDALDDDTIEGINIKKGDTISIYIYGLHRNPKYWENPEKFDPERFSEEKEKERHPYAFIPFGGGPRLCIGQQFAMTEMQIAMALILNKFNFELLHDQEIKHNPAITLRPSHPIMMRFEER